MSDGMRLILRRLGRRPWLPLAALVLSVALIAACEDDEVDGTPTPTPTPEETPTPTPAPAEPATPTPEVRMTPGPGEGPRTGDEIGREATEQDIEPIDIDVVPGGAGLPDGSGTVQDGAEVFAQHCARCHGGQGESDVFASPLVGQPGPWQPGMEISIGSYWPYAETVFDYVRRAMPFDEPGILTDDEVYAVVAWRLYQNEIVDADAEMNRETLPEVEMPNRDNFVPCWPEECQPDIPEAID
jgi:S-disulfanyl-L-cysteine oxidoreductase SoxD